MSHVNHQDGTYLVRDFAHALIVPFAGISRTAADNHFGFLAQGNFFHLVIVHASGFPVQIVFAGSIDNTGSVDQGAVGEVTTVCKVQSHEFVARVEHGEEYGCISLCTGVRLYVGPFCAEDLFQAVDGNLFTLVHYLTATIVTLAGVSFSILVGEAGAHCLHNLVTYKVL